MLITSDQLADIDAPRPEASFYKWAEFADESSQTNTDKTVASIKRQFAELPLNTLQQHHSEAILSGLKKDNWLKFMLASEALSNRGVPPGLRRIADSVYKASYKYPGFKMAMLLADYQWLAVAHPDHETAVNSWSRPFNGKVTWRLISARIDRVHTGTRARRSVHRAKMALGITDKMAAQCVSLRTGSVEGFARLKVHETKILGGLRDQKRRANLVARPGRFKTSDEDIPERRTFFWLCKRTGVSNQAAANLWEELTGNAVSAALVSVDAQRASESVKSEQVRQRASRSVGRPPKQSRTRSKGQS